MKAGEKSNKVLQILTCAASLSVMAVTIGMLVTLFMESLPALRRFGFFNFLTSSSWNYANQIFGALRPLTGTLLSTLLALLAAVPVAIGTAIFLTELCPAKLRGIIGTALELLAAIPSIIYGLWGLFVLAPFIQHNIEPKISKTLGQLPLIGSFFKSQLTGGVNLFTASMILSVMIIPFISSITRDAFNQVPAILKESAYGLGATRWETISQVAIPYTKLTIAGAVTLAMGRALGETMAVAYVIGNRHAALESLFSPYTTITSVMANEFNEASGLQMSALFTLALLLLVTNFLVIFVAKAFFKANK
jgi:phosphate transport system permease protein